MAASRSLPGVESSLRAALPGVEASTDTARFAVDGMTPGLVVSPVDAGEVAAAMTAANDAGAAVIPWGAGRHMALGMPPSRYDVAIDLRRIDHIVEYEPANLTVTVEAGVLLGDLQAELAKHGQWLPLDPPGADGTIGGLLATNRSGPARIVHGAARDLVIGLHVVTAEGHAIKSGGRVVKNVAGYDLAKLHIGAIGTLGVMVEATFKVAPLPARTSSLAFRGELSALMSTLFEIRNLGLAVNSLTIAHRDGIFALSVRFAGGVAAVERSRREAEAIAVSRRLEASDSSVAAEPATGVMARISAPPSAVEQICQQLVAVGAGLVAYPTAGAIRAAWDGSPATSTLEALRTACNAAGGALVVEAAPVELKQRFDTWGEPGGDFALMQRLKQQFDPNGTLSPGRFLGGL